MVLARSVPTFIHTTTTHAAAGRTHAESANLYRRLKLLRLSISSKYCQILPEAGLTSTYVTMSSHGGVTSGHVAPFPPDDISR